jgi:hypothetical protein
VLALSQVMPLATSPGRLLLRHPAVGELAADERHIGIGEGAKCIEAG